jgi:hypothetical protein
MFKEFIKNRNKGPNDISVYPIGENNLEGVKILIDNCFRMGSDNSNVRMATVDPSLWLDKFLNKNWNRISYVSSTPSFNITKVVDNKIVSKHYNTETKQFESEDIINEFFESGRWKSFVIFSIVKYVDVVSLSISYHVRYADITEKYEERDNKLEEILK